MIERCPSRVGRSSHPPTPARPTRLGLWGGVAVLFATSAWAETDFWSFAEKRCLLPLENVAVPDTAGLSRDGARWMLGDAYLEVISDGLFSACTVGLSDANSADVHRQVLERLTAREVHPDWPYIRVEDHEGDGRVAILWESFEWREPVITLSVVSQPALGLLEIAVTEIDKEA